MELLFKDVIFAFRSLRRDPGFTLVAVLALSLGIAFTISIFTVVNGVLITTLDLPESDRILIFLQNTQWGELSAVSYPNYEDWRKEQKSFAHVAACRYTEFNLAGGKTALRVRAHEVTPEFFAVLGVTPVVGAVFPPDSSASRLVVLSYNTWEKAFGGDPGVVGRTVLLDDKPYQVCAVVPPAIADFREGDVFIPHDPSERIAQMRRGGIYSVLGRLKAGVTQKRAQADIDVITHRLMRSYPDVNKDLRVRLVPLQEHLVGESRPRLLALMGAVLFVLLIACLNTASLLLTRGSLRAREAAVRSAIGATRSRMVRQSLVESLVLALAGALVGLMIAQVSVWFLQQSFPDSVPRLKEASLDSHVMAFALIVGCLSALVFGLVPALRSSRTNLGEALKEGAVATTHTSGSLRLRSGMVVAQVALSTVLVIGAGLLIKSYWLLTGVNLGFRTEGLVTAQTALSAARYKTITDQIQFIRETEERLRSLPGVEGVGAANNLTFSNWGFSMSGLEYETSDGQKKELTASTSFMVIRPGFLEALGIACLSGRTFDNRDDATGPRVLILDRTLAHKFFPDGQALHRRILLDKQWRTVVGIVDSIREEGPLSEPKTTLYIPLDQYQTSRRPDLTARVCWAVKTQVPPSAMIPQIRRVLEEIDRDQPIYSVQTMRQAYAKSVSTDRLNTTLMFGFAATALALAAIGLYGVLAYQVTSRTREIGIRIAVGAQRSQVFRHVAAGGLKLVAGGLALGLLAAIGLTKLLAGMLYAVRPLDWSVFLAVALLLLVVGFAALSLPAWNASRLSPTRALRWE